jgi:amidase
MTRSVADAAMILSVIAGRDIKDNYTETAPAPTLDYTQFLDASAIKGKRFGVPRAVFTNNTLTGNKPCINMAFEKALKKIKSLGGVIVDPADLPSAYEILENKSEQLVMDINTKVCLV